MATRTLEEELLEALADCIHQMKLMNADCDDYFGFEINAYTELLKKAKGEKSEYDLIRYGKH